MRAQIRIMPLGDSITMGRHGEPSGYRDDFAIMLLNEGVNFDMVGSVNDGSGFYPRHEGHSGWRADEIYSQLNRWLNMNPADIVLLHIGTNDISQGESNESTIEDIENILNLIRSKNNSSVILLCNLIPRFDPYYNRPERTEQLNVLIYQLFQLKQQQGFNIYFVDQNSAFKANPNWKQEYMVDYVHPNDLGYHVMAESFFNVLAGVLNLQRYAISGQVVYYSNMQPVNGVKISLTGNSSQLYETSNNGLYEFTGLQGNKNYATQPIKERVQRADNDIITMYNAALVLRHAVGLEALTEPQQLAGDVDKDGQVIAYDAAVIARYAVKLPPMSNDFVGEWVFNPQKRSYSDLTKNQTNQNFNAILLGDVSGAWETESSGKNVAGNELWFTDINANWQDTIVVPIQITNEKLLSYEGTVEFPTHLLDFAGIINEIPEMNFLYHFTDNKIIFGAYKAESFRFEGKVATLRFNVLKNTNGFGEVVFHRFQINNEKAAMGIAKVNVNPKPVNQAIIVGNNYPNPFNPATVLPYEITEGGNVNIVIYNALGQKIREMVNQYQSAGKYTISWDGKDGAGMR
ncbi:MAG TPA: T9SS type A sorting domain-containing protein, partial [bacterium]|nr:T9SS type A sorting domain-containing protein [bacterium]